MEFEFSADGHLVPSARAIHEARRAFLNGDLDPLLALQPSLTAPFTVAPSPHLSKILTDILTGKIKRPRRRPTKTCPLSRNEIVEIGIRVRDLMHMGDPLPCNDRIHCCPEEDPLKSRRWHPMKYETAINLVAEGIPALKGWDGEEILDEQYLPPIPKSRVRAAFAAFLMLQHEPRPWAPRPTTTRSPRPKRSSSKK